MDRIDNPDRPYVPAVVSSSFFLTINTNQRAKTVEEYRKVAQPFYQALKSLFGNAQSLAQIVTVLSTMNSFDDDIGSIDTKGTIEYAAHSGIHAHVLVQIIHRTRVQMNPHAVRKTLLFDMQQQGLRLSNLYVDSRFVKDDRQKVLNYIHKQVRGKESRVFGTTEFPDTQRITVEIDIGKVQL
jgi:hypothetical protein